MASTGLGPRTALKALEEAQVMNQRTRWGIDLGSWAPWLHKGFNKPTNKKGGGRVGGGSFQRQTKRRQTNQGRALKGSRPYPPGTCQPLAQGGELTCRRFGLLVMTSATTAMAAASAKVGFEALGEAR